MKTLRDALEETRGKIVRVGADTGFIFCGLSDDICQKFVEHTDPGCLDLPCKDVYESSFNDDIIILYDSETRGRFWSKEEFDKSAERCVYDSIMNNTFDPNLKMEKLDWHLKKLLSNRGYKFTDMRLHDETDKYYVFINIRSLKKLYLNKEDSK
ncbi:MAG: hypothetical protein J6Y02_01060 [Pseudobutyrivibrio sp.]|nr:hypothetical protein [Pseudobutyrivibrio sp.]